MNLTRRAMRNEIRTLEAQARVASATIDTLHRQLLDATRLLTTARHERDRARTDNVRLAHDLEELEAETLYVGEYQREEIRRFMARHPDLFDQDAEGDAA